MTQEYVFLFLICVAAFALKAMAGFGPSIIVISFGSLLILPHHLVAVAAILDMTAGAVLLKLDWDNQGHGFWIPLLKSLRN
ncbi:MAG: hypothetical protein ABIJ59_07970 [Pseudomonadota bacterium]